MKIIDILNKISKNNLKDKTKFKVYSSSSNDSFICEYDESYPGTIWCLTDNGKFNYKIDFMRILNYEVEVIEENKGIEELPVYPSYAYRKEELSENRLKINELVRAVNKLTKEREAN